MNLFDKIVTSALEKHPELSSLKMVVEKELLHHDILRLMRDHDLVSGLTFIGGTCLRLCHGGIRLSEDLDFTGGLDFSRTQLSGFSKVLIENLQDKYGLKVVVSEPQQDKKNVDTWKIKIETRPQARNLPSQRINVDICAVNSYEKRPMLLVNHYGVNLVTTGLIIQAQSGEEIYADKLIALAMRPNRLKYRDLWDIFWLHSQGFKPNLTLIPVKLQDRKIHVKQFLELFKLKRQLLINNAAMYNEFNSEMLRFLPASIINQILKQQDVWAVIDYLLTNFERQLTIL